MLSLAGCRFSELFEGIDLRKELMPKAILGRTGVEVSRLGLGTTPLFIESVSYAGAQAVLHRAVELGVTYIDTAPNYGSSDATYVEKKLGPAIKELRNEIFLVTKTESKDYAGTWDLLRQSLERMQTDHIDLIMLHNIGLESRFPDLDRVFSEDGAVGALREAKGQGLIRFIGISGHMYPTRVASLFDKPDIDDLDVFMNASNFVVQHSYNFEEKVWPKARERNIGLVAMKVLGGNPAGTHVKRIADEDYDDAVRYCLSIEGVSVAVIGCQSIGHVERAVRAVKNFTPLTADEWTNLASKGRALLHTEPWTVAPPAEPEEIYWGTTT